MLSRMSLVIVASWVFAAGAGAGWTANAETYEPAPAESAGPRVPVTFLPVDAFDHVDPPYVPPPLPRLPEWSYTVTSVTPDAAKDEGVGVIVRVTFDQDIPVAARWKIEDSLAIASTNPDQDLTAPWVWLDGHTVAWRPKAFWKPRQTVTVASTWPVGQTLIRIPRNADRPEGKPVRWESLVNVTLTNTVAAQFTIGSEQIVTIDADTHEAVVTRDGKRIGSFPVSLGMPGHETASGIKTVMERYAEKRLYNPGQWDVTVPYAMRLTLSGEFLHSAPWNSQIGYANLSHGCTNVTVEDAQWFYEHLQHADPVITLHGGTPPEPWDGDGAPWNISWSQWKAMAYPAP